ncbi:hypothetical protein ABG39_004939, partial [Salmonella enterica subsp. enterica]|nr:multidrug transporter subunit MdtA [Salmonella enterica]EEC0270094.1 hypothetical protein [Salmonella enterica subsp. enterica]
MFHNSSIFLPSLLTTIEEATFRKTFQDEKLIPMKGSNTFRWAIAIGVVVAAAAFWFWHS